MLWVTPPARLSFLEEFDRTPCQLPESTVLGTTVKGLSMDEIVSSGPSFLHVKPLDISSFTLSHSTESSSDVRNLEWTRSILSTHGHDGQIVSIWSPAEIQYLVPPQISSEGDTAVYIVNAFLKRALAAAICLFNNAAGLAPEPFLSACTILNTSSIGPSGRADLSIQRGNRHCVLVEAKTYRANTSFNISIFEQINDNWLTTTAGTPMDPAGSPQRPEGDINWYGLPWQRKAQKILFQVRSIPGLASIANRTSGQVWHQLVSRNCKHGIVVTEQQFILAYRTGTDLQLTQPYTLLDRDHQARTDSLVHLAFFIAHGFFHGSSDRPDRPSSTQLSTQHSVIAAMGPEAAPQRPVTRHHRSDSAGTATYETSSVYVRDF